MLNFRIASFHRRYDAACILLVSDKCDNKSNDEEELNNSLIVSYPAVRIRF